MKKNISSLLQKGNLTPKERYILLIQNDLEKAKADKGFLTEADIQGLQNWQAKTPAEAREWNKYNEGWKLSGRAGIEAEFVYAETKAEHFRKNIIATELGIYPFYREHLNALQALKKIKVVDIKEAIEITNKQREQKLKDGFNFDYAVYLLAYETLKDDYKKDLKTLYDEVEYDTEYLDNEEIIADLFNGKDELTKEAKEKLAELVAERSYNEFAKEYQLYHYFAGIPIMEIAKKWAKEKGIKPSTKDYEWLEKVKSGLKKKGLTREVLDKAKAEQNLTGEFADEEWLLTEKIKEIIEQYARDNQTTPKEIIKATCLKWLDEGLLIKDHTPIFNSKQKNTYNGDTKHQHDELFKEWLKAKEKARETLKTLADKGELEITADKTGQDKTIAGESLYSFKGDFKFVKDFKERVEKYEANAGLIYADDDPEHKGENIDRELLIAEKDKDGKVNVFSFFGRAIDTIERHFDTTRFFKETTEKDGETYLEFKSEDIEKAFKDTRQSLIDGYKKLLAFQDVFKRLSKTYKADLAFLINAKVEQVSEFIDTHNTYLGNALEDLYGFGVGFGLYKKPLKTRDNLFIEKNKLQADTKTLEEWTGKFEEILGDDF
jgi:hypothetical protein